MDTTLPTQSAAILLTVILWYKQENKDIKGFNDISFVDQYFKTWLI